jgi:hypothetical protein
MHGACGVLSACTQIRRSQRHSTSCIVRADCNAAASAVPERWCFSVQIGFFALIAVEAITGKGFLQLLGITVGRGIGFEI